MPCQSTFTLDCSKERHVIWVGVHQHIFEKSNMFNSFLSLQNLFSSNGLVNISASWSSVPTLSMQMSPFLLVISYEMMADINVLYSCMLNRILVNLIALSLSHSNGTFLNLIPKSLKVAFIQSICAQQLSADMYSASAVDNATLFMLLWWPWNKWSSQQLTSAQGALPFNLASRIIQVGVTN